MIAINKPHIVSLLGFAVIAVALALLVPLDRVSAQTTTQASTIGVTQFATGSTFTVDVLVSSDTPLSLGVAQAYLRFDPIFLQVVDGGDPSGPAIPGPVFDATWEDVIQNSADNVAGLVSFAGGKGRTGSDASSPFVLARIQFQTTAATPAGIGTDLTFEVNVPSRTRAVAGISDTTNVVMGTTIRVIDNLAPAAGDGLYQLVAGSPLNVDSSSGVLSSDSDPDANHLTPILLNGPSNGTLTLIHDGSFTYTQGAGFPGIDSFTYQAFDGVSNSNTATVTLAIGVDVTFTVNLQGRPAMPDPSWVVNFTLDLYSPGVDPLVTTPLYSFTPTTDQNGTFLVNLEPGIYDVRAKGQNSLKVLLPNMDFSAPPAGAVDLGTQISGDSDQDNAVTGGDYSQMLAAFGFLVTDLPTNLKDTDHNGDNIVDAADYAAVVGNFNQQGVLPDS